MGAHRPGLILVLGDGGPGRSCLLDQLQGDGHNVRVAETAGQALQLLADESFDLVLLDIDTPAAGGLDVLRTIRTSPLADQPPTIAWTSKDQGDALKNALLLGADDVLTRTQDPGTAAARVKLHLSHKRAKDALQESEERYALTALGVTDGLWDWDLRRNEFHTSARWKSMIGFDEQEIAHRPEEWFRRIYPDDLERVQATVAAHLGGQTAHFECEYRMLHHDGSYHWMRSRGMAMRDTRGRAVRIAGSQTDITEGKVSDPLTGLPNRLLFMDRLQRSLKRSKRDPDRQFALLFLDLDRFKVINDSLGHLAGDQLLVAIARRLESGLRASDGVWRVDEKHALARLGGDEFTILLDDIRNVREAIRVAERILDLMSKPFDLRGQSVSTSVSIGIALSATGYDSSADLLRDADTAMYRAKAAGKGRYEVFDPTMRDEAVARLTVENALRRAIDQSEFLVHYLPVVALKTGRIVGFEALVRWLHPERGLLLPKDFIYIAEETDMILPIGAWVMRQASMQMKTWMARFQPDTPWTLTINVSSRTIMQPDLVSSIEQILQDCGLDPEFWELDIPETLLMENIESMNAILRRLKSLGIRLAVDDFGTGYSSLSSLHQMPLNTLKVDRSFVGRIGSRGEHSEIVKTIVVLARNMGLQVTAEGVETFSQAALLQSLGCDFGQGSYFSMPVDAETAEELLVSSHLPQTAKA